MTEVQADSRVVLTLTVRRLGGVGVTGLSPVVAVRCPAPAGYLDWADGVFKPSGWTLRQAPMAEISAAYSPGVYELALDLANVPAAVPGFAFVAEYLVDNGADVRGMSTESYTVAQTAESLAILRAVAVHRVDEAPGNPGSLVVYRADGTTPFLSYQLRDFVGGPTLSAPGAPARRSAAVITP